MLNRNIPGGTYILLAILVVPLVWLFGTRETDEEKRETAKAEFAAKIPSTGTVGRWYDDLGSRSYGDSTITIASQSGRFMAKRVSGDGSESDLVLNRASNQSTVFHVEGDKRGAYYIVTPAGLELHDRKGYIRTAKLIGNK